jgi:hypothetical protein
MMICLATLFTKLGLKVILYQPAHGSNLWSQFWVPLFMDSIYRYGALFCKMDPLPNHTI